MPSLTAETSEHPPVVLERGDRASIVMYQLATIAAALLLILTVAVLW